MDHASRQLAFSPSGPSINGRYDWLYDEQTASQSHTAIDCLARTDLGIDAPEPVRYMGGDAVQ